MVRVIPFRVSDWTEEELTTMLEWFRRRRQLKQLQNRVLINSKKYNNSNYIVEKS